MNNNIETKGKHYVFDNLIGTVIKDHVEDAREYLSDGTIDIILSVNDLSYGLNPKQFSCMLSKLDPSENFLPFSFAIGDYTVVGYLREDTHTKYQFSIIHLFDSLSTLLRNFLDDLEDRGFPTGQHRTAIGLRISVFDPFVVKEAE